MSSKKSKRPAAICCGANPCERTSATCEHEDRIDTWTRCGVYVSGIIDIAKLKCDIVGPTGESGPPDGLGI